MDITKQLMEIGMVFLVSIIFIVGMAVSYSLILIRKEEKKQKKDEDQFYKKNERGSYEQKKINQ